MLAEEFPQLATHEKTSGTMGFLGRRAVWLAWAEAAQPLKKTFADGDAVARVARGWPVRR